MLEETRKEEMLLTLKTLFQDGEVVEVRILKSPKGIISGYFSDFEKLVDAVAEHIGQRDIYVTLNSVKAELLSRCSNRLENYTKNTTSDAEII